MTDAQKLCEAFCQALDQTYRAGSALNPAQTMARWAARQTKGFEILHNEMWLDGQRKWVRCPDGSRFAYSFGDPLVQAQAWAAPAEAAV